MKEATQKALKAFAKLAGFVDQRRKEEVQEYEDFLSFYKALVEETPVSAVEGFGKLSVKMSGASVGQSGSAPNWGLSLTVTDYLWWESKIREQRVRFLNGPASIRRLILNQMGDTAEQLAATPEHRKRLLELLRDPSNT